MVVQLYYRKDYQTPELAPEEGQKEVKSLALN
jgi:hypothetical protein